jgi:putative two-component system response regulator
MSENHDRPTVLLVDDTPGNISVINAILKENYKTRIATSGAKALELARMEPLPDIVLLDIVMPEMDGYEVCMRLKADPLTRDIPIVFLTGKTDVEDETRGFETGAVDYIHKPFTPAIVLARVRTHLLLREARVFLKHQNAILERRVEERTYDLALMQDATILAMGSLAETRDNETGNHLRRTQLYIKVLASRLSDHPRFSHLLDSETINLLYKTAPLHDIGKVGVADRILLKPGKLDVEEFELMKMHAVYGRDAILQVEKLLGATSSFLRVAREIAYSHHEKWDGSGYPQGLAGEAIPVSARLMAIADVYDALISRRIYKPPFTHDNAVAIIAEGKGRHFDPDIAAAFLDAEDEFQAIARALADQ